jgi:hypothetical protein
MTKPRTEKFGGKNYAYEIKKKLVGASGQFPQEALPDYLSSLPETSRKSNQHTKKRF